MHVRKHNKRGVSPLIATILLAMFALSLGSVIVNWSFNIQSRKQGSCAEISFNIRNTQEAQMCIHQQQNQQTVQFVVDNIGDARITGFDVWMIGSTATKLSSIDDIDIHPNEIYVHNKNTITYEEEVYGELHQVQLYPKVGTHPVVLCSQQAVTASSIDSCQVS